MKVNSVKAFESAEETYTGGVPAQEHLEKSQRSREVDEFFRIMLDVTPFGANFWDKDMNLIDVNQAVATLFRMPDKQLYIDNFAAFSPERQPDGRLSSEVSATRLQEVFETGYCRFEYVHQTLDGEPVPCEITGVRVDYKGEPLVAVYIRDLREQREHEKQLMLAQELNERQLTKLNLMVKATRIGLWDMEVVKKDQTDPANVVTWSDDFRHMLGFADETDFPNTLDSWSDRLHPDDHLRTLSALTTLLLDTTGNIHYDVEHRLMKKNGEYGYFRSSGETIRDEKGNVIRVAGALQDITETKNLIAEAENQRSKAEEANKAKSAFLSTMSHEIRTPMNAILGITEIQLQNEMLDSKLREALEKIYSSGDLLLGIINDILDLSKIEAGKLELVIGSYDTASLLSDTAQLNMMRIGSKQIEFELNIDETIPSRLLGDELRVKQILNNLLSNAFKYTTAGIVKLSVCAQASTRSDDEVILIVSISDTGQGMTKKQVDRLFDEYARFNEKANREKEGTGLGMSITRDLLRLMNGKISVDSVLGKGSVFTVHLPQGKTDSPALGKEMADNLRQFRTRSKAHMKRVQVSCEPMPYGRVLIVDDVETNIYVARGLMTPYELIIDSAGSGYSAIDKVRRGNTFDIIFMDHMMPKLDGVETTKILRAMGYTGSIVALTANAVAGQSDLFLNNGFDDVIFKPIDLRQLNLVLNKLIRDRRPPDSAEVASTHKGVRIAQSGGERKTHFDLPPQFAEVFARDAQNSLAVLDKIIAEGNLNNNDDLRTYIIHIHGMKSALANVGNMELSADALKLEQSAREGNIKAISAESPAFLRLLHNYVQLIAPENSDEDDSESNFVEEDTSYLYETLLVIRAACEEYDDNTVGRVLKELGNKTWSQPVKKLLITISGLLLHSDFDKVSETITEFMMDKG